MSRTRWIERGVLVLALIVAGWSWRTANQATRRADRLSERVDALADLTEKLAKQGAASRVIPSADLFQSPSAQAGRSGGIAGLGGFGAAGGRAGGASAGGAAGGDGAVGSDGVPITPAMRRQAREASQSPGAVFLETLYQAADQLAAEQNWDARTYDDVTRVFDDTVLRMNGLLEKAKAGEVPMREARRDALQLRNKAVEDLRGIIGDDGVLSLRDAFVDEVDELRGGK